MGRADRRIGWVWFWLASGIGAVIALIAAPDLPKFAVFPLIGFAGVSFTLAAYNLEWFKAPYPVGRLPRVILVLVIIWGPLAYLGWKVYPRISVDMSFDGADLAQWQISNRSNVDVENIVYEFMLIDFDQPFITHSPTFPNVPYAPLQIPVAKIDFIKAGDAAGGVVLPLSLLNQVRAGDRIFGIGSFLCPKCEEKGYWLYLVHRGGGWFAPLQGTWRGRTLPVGAIVNNPEKELNNLVPPASRSPIR